MDSLLIEARKPSRDPRECRRTLDALRAIGIDEDAFSALHHQHGSAAVFYNYCGGVQRYRDDDNNHRVHQRLMYVLMCCPNGAPQRKKSLQTLAEEAVKLIPFIRP